MHRVQICVELSDASFRAFTGESGRLGVTVESLVQIMVQSLLDESQRDEREGTDHPIFVE